MTIRTNTSALGTIGRFNGVRGHDTLHPLGCLVEMPRADPDECVGKRCDFCGLLRTAVGEGDSEMLKDCM